MLETMVKPLTIKQELIELRSRKKELVSKKSTLENEIQSVLAAIHLTELKITELANKI
ncbi:MAG: hypothetical protein V4699_03120 [Patescibacteria group bacterium]